MKRFESLGSVLIVLGVSILGGYGVFLFLQSPAVPLFIRIGAGTVILGIVLILVSLIWESLKKKGGIGGLFYAYNHKRKH